MAGGIRGNNSGRTGRNQQIIRAEAEGTHGRSDIARIRRGASRSGGAKSQPRNVDRLSHAGATAPQNCLHLIHLLVHINHDRRVEIKRSGGCGNRCRAHASLTIGCVAVDEVAVPHSAADLAGRETVAIALLLLVKEISAATEAPAESSAIADSVPTCPSFNESVVGLTTTCVGLLVELLPPPHPGRDIKKSTAAVSARVRSDETRCM